MSAGIGPTDAAPAVVAAAQPAPAPPEVTVVIPTHDRRALLAKTIASVLAQEDVDLEVVVVDDGSTDDTPAALAALGDPRVRVLRHERPSGPAHARNAGIEQARGAWVAFLDDDDVWAPHKLRAQLDAAGAAGATYAFGSAAVFDDHGDVRQVMHAPDPVTVARDIVGRNVIPGGCSNLIARTEVVRALGGFDERLRVLADWELWIRIAQAGPGAACQEVLVGYRRHAGSMVLSGEANALRELDAVMAAHRGLADEHGIEPSSLASYRYFARAHRRAGRFLEASRLYAVAARRNRSAGDVARAVAVLSGPIGRRVAKRVRPRPAAAIHPTPAWLRPYL